MLRPCPMRRKNIFKVLLIGLVLLLGAALAGLEIFARLYQEQAGIFLRQQFNQQSDLVLRPFETSVSVWRHFPRITFVFKQITVVDTSGGAPMRVLAVQQAEVAVPLGQYRLDRLNISRVHLAEVLFHQRIDSLGRKRSLRFRPADQSTADSGGFSLVIPKFTISRARIISENFYKKSAFTLNLDQADLEARLQDRKLTVKGSVSGKIDSVLNNRIVLLRQEPFTGKVQYEYLPDQKQGKIFNTAIVLNKNKIQLSGTHQALPTGAGTDLNFRVTGYQPMLYVLTQLMPPQAKTFLQHVKTNSRLHFSYQITGASGPMLRPRNIIQFRLDKGDLYLPATKRLIKDVQLTGEMDNGPLHSPETSRFTLSNFSAHTQQDSFRVALTIQNFVKPEFTFQGTGQIALAELAGMINMPFTAVQGGSMQGKISLRGKIPLPGKPPVAVWQGQGALTLQSATFQPVGLSVICRNVNGVLRFENNVLRLHNLHGLIGGHSFKMQASVKNFFAYLFDEPGRISSRATVQAAYLNSDWLLDEPVTQTKKSVKSRQPNPTAAVRPAPAPTRQNSLADMDTQLNLQVGRVYLPLGEHVRNLTVQVNQQDEKVTLTHMRFVSPKGGVATADGGFQYYQASGMRAPYLNVRLHYPELNLQSFMQDLATLKKGEPGEVKSTAAKTNVKKEPFYTGDDYRLNLQVKTQRLRYLYLEGTDVILQADLNSRQAKISRLDFHSAGGEVHIRGTMQLDAPGEFTPLNLRVELHQVALPQLFQMAERMQLDVLSSQNIRGEVACQVAVRTSLDQTFSPSLDRTVAYAKANFQRLELIEVAPIQQALRLLRKERTRHLYFENVTTSFLLRNNEFLTPALSLNSNLTAFQLAGTYTMGGGADLNMDVSLLPALFGNNKRRIEKIQNDSLVTRSKVGKQHLVLRREQNKFKVRLINRKQREQRASALLYDFQKTIRQYQIDTVFSMHQ